jgi:alkylation response protein AidB-like acyl-CoA dehydrogenase
MDFELTEAQKDVTALAMSILTREKDEAARWRELGKAGLLDSAGGDLLAHCAMLAAAGAAAVTSPVHAAATAAFALDKLAPELPRGSLCVLAIHEPDGADPYAPSVRFVDGALHGVKTCVACGPVGTGTHGSLTRGGASHALVTHACGLALADLSKRVAREAQVATTGAPHEQLTFDGTPAIAIGDAAARAWLLDVAAIGLCAMELGICEEVLKRTAAYTSQRVQFDRPIATFQAVAQRAADAYIDVETLRVTTWEAAWRLAEGLPAAREVAIAKAFAAEAGARVVYAAQHLHGGIGFDLEFGLARYYPLSKWIELQLGGASAQYARLGAMFTAT